MEAFSVKKTILDIIYEVTGKKDIQEDKNFFSKENGFSAIEMVYIYQKVEEILEIKLNNYVEQGPECLNLNKMVEYICSYQ